MVIIFIGFNSIFITIEQGQNLDQSQGKESNKGGAMEIDKYKRGMNLYLIEIK
jgi:hypothetical protein